MYKKCNVNGFLIFQTEIFARYVELKLISLIQIDKIISRYHLNGLKLNRMSVNFFMAPLPTCKMDVMLTLTNIIFIDDCDTFGTACLSCKRHPYKN